jgi:uncharacterized protein (DUF58 family)
MPARPLNHYLDELREADLACLARVADPLLAGRPLLGNGHRPHRLRAGQGHEFLDHQEYVPGDDLRNLDWRATARSRHPQLRRYRDEQTADWQLCLDCSASMTLPGPEKWRLAVQLTAALGYLLLHLGHRVSLFGFHRDCRLLLPPGRGRQHYARLARRLRDLAPLPEGGASELQACASHLGERNPVMVISDLLVGEDLQPALRRIIGGERNLHLLHIIAAGDCIAPAHEGALELRDIETGARRTLPAGAAASAQAQEAFRDWRAQLLRYCASHAIRYTACPGEQTWKTVLMQHLKGLQARHA